ncbi:zinc-binding dehydrogenase [Streptomyces mirabilis]
MSARDGRDAEAPQTWSRRGFCARPPETLACTRLGGTVIVLGTPTDQGSRLELDALALIGQQVTIASVRGATLRDQQLCLQLLADKKITPIIDRAYPLEQAAEAHTYLESHRQTGKVLLLP